MTKETKPELFADTSDLNELDKLMSLGLFTGITTNPLIVAKQAGLSKPSSYYQQLANEYPNLPISIQLLDEPLDLLVQHAREFTELGDNIVVKIPMFPDGRGLSLLPRLTSEGIKTNVTALMSAEQMLAVLITGENLGPTYASLFFNRIKDGNGFPEMEIMRSRYMIDQSGSHTKIITGSIRKPEDVYDALESGSHIVTVPPAIANVMDIQRALSSSYYPIEVQLPLKQQIAHPQSIKFINDSQIAWEKFLIDQG